MVSCCFASIFLNSLLFAYLSCHSSHLTCEFCPLISFAILKKKIIFLPFSCGFAKDCLSCVIHVADFARWNVSTWHSPVDFTNYGLYRMEVLHSSVVVQTLGSYFKSLPLPPSHQQPPMFSISAVVLQVVLRSTTCGDSALACGVR